MTALVQLRPGVLFEEQAAASWARMEVERGQHLDTNRTTVSREAQQIERDKYLAYMNGTGPWAPLALDPDDSWHCEPIARASDTDDDEWIRAHPDHGWRFVVKSERWHAQYYPHLDLHRHEGFPAGFNPTPFEEDDMFSDADRALLQDVNNKLSIEGAGYGRPEVIQQRVDTIVDKLETGGGYDWLPAIANQNHAILAALGSMQTGAPIDVQALAAELRGFLGDELAAELAERLAS